MKKLLCFTLALVLILATPAFAVNSSIVAPSGVLLTEDGSLILTGTYNHAIWERNVDGTYEKIAGRSGVVGADNVPIGAYNDGEALEAAFNTPWAIAEYRDGYAITDSKNGAIRYFAGGTVGTLSCSSSFTRPTGIVADDDGGLYISDSDKHLIRYVDDDGSVSIYAGSDEGMADGKLKSAKFCDPTGLAYFDGALYVADTGNNRICKIEDGIVSTIAGGIDGYVDGSLDVASFSAPMGLAVTEDAIYVSDTANSAVRCIVGDVVKTLVCAGDNQLFPIAPRGLAVDGDTLWICDTFSQSLSSVSTKVQIFDDVALDTWYADAVLSMKSHGYIDGTSATTFEPENGMTRAMFTQILFNMEGAVPVNYLMTFTDCNDAWYTEAIRWASSEKIVSGMSETEFAPNELISRQDMISMLHHYVEWKNGETTKTADLSAFSDSDDIADYASDAMLWAYGAGIIEGYEDGTIAPKLTATRAVCATLITNYINLI